MPSKAGNIMSKLERHRLYMTLAEVSMKALGYVSGTSPG